MIAQVIIAVMMLVVACAVGVSIISMVAVGASAIAGAITGYANRGVVAADRRQARREAGAQTTHFELAGPTGLDEYAGCLGRRVGTMTAEEVAPRRAMIDETALEAILADAQAIRALEFAERELVGVVNR